MEMQNIHYCPNCSEQYNKVDRQMLILPCGDEMCLDCFELLLQPLDNKLQCPYEGIVHFISDKYLENIQKLKQQLAPINIFCDEHPDKEVDYFCKQHHRLMCNRCAILEHADHREVITHAERVGIEAFCDKARIKLFLLKNKILEVCDMLNSYKQCEKGFGAEEFMVLVREAQGILLPHLKSQQEKADIEFFNNVNTIIPAFQKQVTIKEFEPSVHSSPSKKTQTKIELLKEWIGGNPQLALLFKGSRDGFTSQKFHQVCDNQGPTISLISTEFGNLFGGFTSLPWTAPSFSDWKKDDKAFVFSLSYKTKHPLVQNKQQSVDHSKDYMIAFGGGHDIRISSNCNTNAESYCNFGFSYELPQGINFGSDEAKTYLGGAYQFKVLEIEVYKVSL